MKSDWNWRPCFCKEGETGVEEVEEEVDSVGVGTAPLRVWRLMSVVSSHIALRDFLSPDWLLGVFPDWPWHSAEGLPARRTARLNWSSRQQNSGIDFENSGMLLFWAMDGTNKMSYGTVSDTIGFPKHTRHHLIILEFYDDFRLVL